MSWPIGARFENVLHHFGKPCVFKFTSRHYISSGVYNSASSSDAMFGKKDVTYLLTYLRTQSNLRTSLPCTTSLVVAGSKQYRTISAVRFVKSFRSDAGGLASLGRRSGSVRRRSANGRDLLTHLLTYLRTQSNLRTSLRSYVTDRSGSKAYRNDQL